MQSTLLSKAVGESTSTNNPDKSNFITPTEILEESRLDDTDGEPDKLPSLILNSESEETFDA